MRRAAYALLLRARTGHEEFALDGYRRAQRAEPGAARESQALDLFQLLGRRIAPDLNIDRHLAERRRGCLGDHMAACIKLGACDRLEGVVCDAKLSRVEGKHRRVAADRAGEQKFKRRWCAILSAHMGGLADEEFVPALLALDQFVELADRGHLYFDKTLRSLRCLFFRMRAIAALAGLGDLLQLRKAIADFGHGWILKRERNRPSLSLALVRLH